MCVLSGPSTPLPRQLSCAFCPFIWDSRHSPRAALSWFSLDSDKCPHTCLEIHILLLTME